MTAASRYQLPFTLKTSPPCPGLVYLAFSLSGLTEKTSVEPAVFLFFVRLSQICHVCNVGLKLKSFETVGLEMTETTEQKAA